MKFIALPLFAGLLLAGAASAAEAPQPASANCVLHAEDGLQGTSVELNVGTVSADQQTLPFKPRSFFLADGYAVKLFTKPKFEGSGQIVDNAFPWGDDRKLPGGYSHSLALYKDVTYASASCVKAGVIFPNDTTGIRYFNDRTFGASGYRGTGSTASITFKDDRRTVEVHTGGGYAGPGTTMTLDLSTGDITLVSDRGTYVYHRVGIGYDTASMAYTGAAAVMAGKLSTVLANHDQWPLPPYSVPLLELQPAISYLSFFVSR